MAYQVAATYEADVEYAHFTLKSSRSNVKTHKADYYSNKSEYARSGVDLPNGVDYSRARTWATKIQQKYTNQYCPTEGAMSSDDTPLIIESGNELPARDEHRIIII